MKRRVRTHPAATALVGLLFFACATGRTMPFAAAVAECKTVRDQGVFNRETLACFPQVAKAVEERLCEVDFGTHNSANWAGFSHGSPVFGQALVPGTWGVDRARVANWKAEHCRETADRTVLSPPEVVAFWGDLYARLPVSLAGPWRNCWLSASDVWRNERGLVCDLIGAFDLDGEDGESRFAVWSLSRGWLDFGTLLRADLEVEGADCGGEEWKAGSRIPTTKTRVLECRRRGRSAVRVKLVTGAGTCERSLPELTERPWRELCPAGGTARSP